MPDNISPLVAADEKLNHETVDSFSAVATSDLAWIEKVWSSWFSIQSTLSPRIVDGLAVDGLAHHMRTISLPRCLRSLEEIRRRRGHIIEKRTHHRHQHRCLPRDADVRRRRQNHQARGRNLLQHPRRWGRYGPTDAPECRVVARIYWWRHSGSRAES